MEQDAKADGPTDRDAAPSGAPKRAETRVQSTIEFPYLDEENALEIAVGVHDVGGSGCDWDQLAAHFKQAANGGGFRMRLITAKMFGLVTYDRGKISLTPMGLRAVDPQQQQAAKVDAFLHVPLYKAIYERFRGGTLPKPQGLEGEMHTLGVAPKQTDKARQVFQRSAKFAGFFDFGSDRLVLPKTSMAPQPAVSEKTNSREEKPHAEEGGQSTLHPFVVGLLCKLPPPDEAWSAKDRAKWLQTAANIFDLMYTGATDGEISVDFKKAEGSE